MPTYEYYCETNGESIDVIHSMQVELTTWGELCELAEIDCGATPTDSTILRQLSAIASLIPKGGTGPRGGSGGGGGRCGGGGCGCSGN